ncbi:multidrug MFS transporter [Aureimonas sp. Leaf454]|uniref:MFS transporter n=1 Tax=Aureimonas sp. Leaf454 TaxID=1736381 RepID=UPI0006F6C3AA|nr:MFS transporter [Aureimonas sp. Leaf454]KQT48878.1 multidrug MFS transporter [Aureimonas sp. Leaf454]
MPLQDGLAKPQRTLAFSAIAIATFVAVLDGAIANIALPPITADLGIEPVDAIWIVNAYQLAVTMALLPLASLGEIVGYRKVYLGGVALFTAASLLCALSASLPTLVAARALQGLGAAGIMSINIALVRFVFPQSLLGRALGYVAMTVAVSSAAGPSIAGVILSVASWQSLFLVNVPIGLLTLLIGHRTLPKTERSGRRFDVRSALLSAATFGLVISGVNGLGHAEGVSLALLQIGAGLAIGIAFTRTQLSMPAPMLPVDLLRLPVIALSAVTSICSFSAQAIAFICLPFLLHDTLGRSAAETGLLMSPWPIATAFAAVLSGRLADRYPPGQLAAVGLFVFAGGLLALALLPNDPTDIDLIWRLVIAGFGFGIFQTPNNKVLIASAPRERSGGASGIQSTARLVGQSMGTALLAVIYGLVAAGPNTAALFVATALAAAGILPSALRRFEPSVGSIEADAAPAKTRV